MKKIVSTTMLALIVCYSSYSQTKKENLTELFKLMEVDKMMDKMYGSIIPMMQSQMRKSVPDSLQTTKSKAMMDDNMKVIMEESKKMASDFLNNDMVGIYEKNFSDQEVKDLVAFYKTSTGKRMIEKTPAIQQETMQIMMTKYMPKFQETMKNMIEKMAEKKE
ncbi:MAG: DUF2059 domain-containing protein [Arcicella sp.]|nr:DUF2059 domain-containing protein [Arcicella sp.]